MQISDSTDQVPRSRRSGLPIPPELRDAVDQSLENSTTKRVDVNSETEANQVRSLLRSLRNREGYTFDQGYERNDQGKVVAVLFRTKDKVDPKRKKAR